MIAPPVTPVSPAPLPRGFVRLASSNLAAQCCEQLALAASPLVAVISLGASAAETGYLQSLQTLPFLILSTPAGVVADRYSRRAVMVISEIIRSASLLCILLVLFAQSLSLPLLAVLGFVGAVGTVAYNVAGPAFVSALVTRDRLADANRWLELTRSIAFTAGPTLGGFLVGWVGAALAYVIATLFSLAAIFALLGLPEPSRAASPRRHPAKELLEGATFVLQHSLLRPILVTAVFFNTSWYILQAVYVAYAVHDLGLTPSEVGITLGLYGGGMVAGALAGSSLARHLSLGTMILIGPTCGLAGAAVLLSTIWLPHGWLAGAGFLLFGVGPIIWTIMTTTLRQAVSPNAMLGRISAIVTTASMGARPIGAALGALIASRYGAEACLQAALVGFAIQLVVILWSPVPRLIELPRVGEHTT